MTARSTRNRLRWQIGRAINDVNRCQSHLKQIDEMGEGQSAHINKFLPNIVEVSEMLVKVLEAFREGL